MTVPLHRTAVKIKVCNGANRVWAVLTHQNHHNKSNNNKNNLKDRLKREKCNLLLMPF